MKIYRGTNKTDTHTHTHITSIFRDKLSFQGARIGRHSGRLGVKSYEEYYQTALKAEVKRQYQVQGLHDMLLSP